MEQVKELNRIIVEPYNPDWKNWFDSLHSAIWPVVQPWAVSIEHVGSTSVEGLSAKPVIDIDIVLENVKSVAPTISALETLGYSHRGNLGIEGREAFYPPKSPYKHNLYVCLKGNASLLNHLFLKNALISDSELRDQYGKLKAQLALNSQSIGEYTEGKTALILEILQKAGMSISEIEKIKAANRASASKRLIVDSNSQTAKLYERDEVLKTYTVSTARNGLSCQEGSNCTPIGKLKVASKIGGGLPLGSIIRGRVPSGEIWSFDDSNEDLVLTRLLWLEGAEDKNANTFKRYIYLHGTNQEGLLGTRASHGCIRFSNQDIIEIFDALQAGDEVFVN